MVALDHPNPESGSRQISSGPDPQWKCLQCMVHFSFLAWWLQTILDLLLMCCNCKPWMFGNGMSMHTCLFADLLLKFLPCYRTWQNHRGGVCSGHNQDPNLHQHLHVVSLTANVWKNPNNCMGRGMLPPKVGILKRILPKVKAC